MVVERWMKKSYEEYKKRSVWHKKYTWIIPVFTAIIQILYESHRHNIPLPPIDSLPYWFAGWYFVHLFLVAGLSKLIQILKEPLRSFIKKERTHDLLIFAITPCIIIYILLPYVFGRMDYHIKDRLLVTFGLFVLCIGIIRTFIWNKRKVKADKEFVFHDKTT